MGIPFPVAEFTWDKLEVHYCEPQRHYHNLTHIASSLGHLDAHAMVGSSLIEGAIWFHDVIYDPVANDNEEASAAFFRKQLGDRSSAGQVADIERLILVTDFRSGPAQGVDECLMVDIDLAILGSPPETYDVYRSSIRREYAHVPDEAFRIGRAKVLHFFLERPVFRTAWFASFESVARENLARELALLESGSPF